MSGQWPVASDADADARVALQEALDARRDPLDEPRVREWLLRHPEELEAFAAMRAGLDALERPGAIRAPPPRRRPRLVLPLATAAALLVLLLWPPRTFAPAPIAAPPALAVGPSAPLPSQAASAGAILAVQHTFHVEAVHAPMPRSAGPAVLFAHARFTRTSP